MLTRFRAAGLMWPSLAMLPALAILIGLGTWQWQRMAWKTALVAQIEARAKEAPLDQSQALALRCDARGRQTSTHCEYRRVQLHGRFNHSGERHVFAGVQSVGRKSGIGFWVFTPFTPVGASRSVYVNRGFVPDVMKSSSSRAAGLPEGVVEIVAQVRSRELRSWFDGENDRTKNIYYVRNPHEFAGYNGGWGKVRRQRLSLITSGRHYLEIIAAPGQTGFPRPLAGTIAIPNRHFEYAFTWWGLALTLIGVYGSFAWSRLRMVA